MDSLVASDGVLPAVLRRDGNLQTLPWRSVGMGVRLASLSIPGRAFLFDFPPGFRIPNHGHVGVERGLVLRGGFEDAHGHFVRGDVSWRDEEEEEHVAVIDDDGPCTTLFVTDAPARVGGPLTTRLLDWWLAPGARGRTARSGG